VIAIVVGGLMGLSAAFHLRRDDPSIPVTVLERERVGAAASGASAAGVRVMGRDPAERALALESLARWPDLDRELEGATHYRRDGGLRVALDDTAWTAVPAWVAAQHAHGVKLDILDAAATREAASGVAADCLGGVYAPIDGQAEAMPTVEAFARAARRLGARIEEGAGVRRVLVERGRAVGVERAGRHLCSLVGRSRGYASNLLDVRQFDLDVTALPRRYRLRAARNRCRGRTAASRASSLPSSRAATLDPTAGPRGLAAMAGKSSFPAGTATGDPGLGTRAQSDVEARGRPFASPAGGRWPRRRLSAFAQPLEIPASRFDHDPPGSPLETRLVVPAISRPNDPVRRTRRCEPPGGA
jgi:hypothetical protein